MKKVLFPIAFAVILLLTIGASIAVLEMLARTIWPSTATLEHILTPGFKARYTTSEFDFVASINDFGFRGDEVDIEPGQGHHLLGERERHRPDVGRTTAP